MSDNQEKIIERVKKMMALANCSGATEGERDNALRMAYNLLAKHNLDMAQVDAHTIERDEPRESQQAKFVVYPWARSIASLVGSLFFCNYYFQRSYNGKQATHTFVGKASNSTTASYLADFVVRSVTREGARLYGSIISPEGRSFAVGVVHKLKERIAEIKATHDKQEGTSTALALVNLDKSEREANALWLKEQGVILATKVSHTKGVGDRDAYAAGRDFGGRVSLSPQVGGGASRTKLIA